MIGEIIAIGDELTSGRILNSTSSFAAGHLFAAGHEIIAMSTVGDTADMIGEALQKALNRADFVIVTGGLGATTDDLTNEAVSNALDRPFTFRPEIIEKLRSLGHTLSECPSDGNDGKHSLEKLAWLPEGAQVLKPEAKMAGYLLVHDKKPIFFLPGVPYEMRELMLDSVLPRLSDWDGQSARQVLQKIYKVFGQSEMEINRKLAGLEQRDPGIRVGYYPVFPEVHVSMTVTALDPKEADSLFRQCDADIQSILNPFIYGSDEETMEAVVGKLLIDHNKRLAVAESCTGGLVAHRITRVPGSSLYF
ncbi:MAG: CinA family protein, partial [Desulfobulbaceae bacterium]|nr:CinA family protein [Desulfobulbaceae bacterium]